MNHRHRMTGAALWLLCATAQVGAPDAASLSVKLLDRHYADPAQPEHVQNAIPQDGRSLWLRLSYRYR